MREQKYILFDLDGTLTDPYEGISKCFRHTLKYFGIIENDETRLRSLIGPPLHDTLKFYLTANNIPESECETAVKVYRERFSTKGLYENKLYDGVENMLERLEKAGYIMAVASSKAEIYVKQIAENFDISKYFKFIGGSELDGRRSEKVEIIKYALDALNICSRGRDSSCVYMVGDRKHDIRGAEKAGIHSVGVLYGYGSHEELKAAGADYIVKDIDELTDLFLKIY